MSTVEAMCDNFVEETKQDRAKCIYIILHVYTRKLLHWPRSWDIPVNAAIVSKVIVKLL